MLKIIKASEPMLVEQIVLCIYSPPGLGKTTLGFTADSPLDFDADKGAYRAKNRKDTVPAPTWAAIETMTADELRPYKTLLLDTAGRALDLLAIDIIAKDPKAGSGGTLNLKGFGQLKKRFSDWLKMVRLFGKDVVLICHMDEQRSGDEVIERLDVQGGSKGEIYKSADAMGRIFVKNNGERFIDFNPRENSFGKNPCELPIMPIPLSSERCLAEIIATIKDRLNASVEVEKEADREMQDWGIAINECSTVEELNQLLPEVKKASPAIRFLAQKRAKDLGFAFDRTAGIYKPNGAPQTAGAAR
jgi:hypothetical protein